MRSTNKWAQTAYQLIAVIASVSFSYSSLISIERNGIDHHIIYKNHRRSIDWNKSIKRYRRSSPICDDYLIVRVRIAHVDERSIHVRYKLRPPSTHDQCERLMERQKHYPGKSSSFPSQQRVVERRLFQLDITTAVIKCFVDRHLFKESQRKISDLYKEVEYVFDDLKPFTKYRITFDLYDELRRRIPITSFQFDAVTKQSVPSEPLDVMASIHNSTAIRVSWRPPKYHNGEIRSYGVKYLAFGDESKKGKIDLTANHRSVTITSLLPETKYILSVFANTIAGDGKHSSEIEVTTPSLKPLTAIGFNAYIEHSNKKGAIANGNSGLLIVVHWTYSRKAFILPEFFNLWVWRRSFPLTSNSQKKPPSYLIAGPIRIERRATSSYSYSMKAAYGYCYEFSLESRTRKFRGERNATTRLCTWNMSPIYLQKAVSKLNISIDTNKYEAYHDDNSNVNPQTFPQISSKFRSKSLDQPNNLGLSHISPNAVRIVWEVPHVMESSTIASYQVRYKIVTREYHGNRTKTPEGLLLSDSNSNITNTSSNFIELHHLQPETEYIIQVTPWLQIATSDYQSPITFHIEKGKSSETFSFVTLSVNQPAPQIIRVDRPDPGTIINLEWEPVRDIYGRHVPVYRVWYSDGGHWNEVVVPNRTQIRLTNLRPRASYIVAVQSTSLRGNTLVFGNMSEHHVLRPFTGYIHDNDIPKPIRLQIIEMSADSAKLRWFEPMFPDSHENRLKSYIITYGGNGEKKFVNMFGKEQSLRIEKKTTNRIPANQRRTDWLITNLEPNTQYYFNVSSVTNDNRISQPISVINATKESVPKFLTAPAVIGAGKGNVVWLKLTQTTQRYGKVNYYLLFVLMQNSSERISTNSIHLFDDRNVLRDRRQDIPFDIHEIYSVDSLRNRYKRNLKSDITYPNQRNDSLYISANISSENFVKEFPLGDGKFYNNFINRKLHDKVFYRVFLRACGNSDQSNHYVSSTFSNWFTTKDVYKTKTSGVSTNLRNSSIYDGLHAGNNSGDKQRKNISLIWIIGSVCAIIFSLLICVCAILFYRSNYGKRKSHNRNRHIHHQKNEEQNGLINGKISKRLKHQQQLDAEQTQLQNEYKNIIGNDLHPDDIDGQLNQMDNCKIPLVISEKTNNASGLTANGITNKTTATTTTTHMSNNMTNTLHINKKNNNNSDNKMTNEIDNEMRNHFKLIQNSNSSNCPNPSSNIQNGNLLTVGDANQQPTDLYISTDCVLTSSAGNGTGISELSSMALSSSGGFYNSSMPFHMNEKNRLKSYCSATTANNDPVDAVEALRSQNTNTSLHMHPPIPAERLQSYIEYLKTNDSIELTREYESIETGQQFAWNISLLPQNRSKNRYANVVSYNHSRVILEPMNSNTKNILSPSNLGTSSLDGESNDYINANYISGYRRSKAYIATQGPLPETFVDFWRMIWQEKTPIIVMLCQLEEKNRIKCDQYWPSRESEQYGNIVVHLLECTEYAYFTIRLFRLHLMDPMNQEQSQQQPQQQQYHQVRQFQYTAWPEHGVPEYPTAFIMFVRRIQIWKRKLFERQYLSDYSHDEFSTPSPSTTTNTNNTITTATTTTGSTNQISPNNIPPIVVHCSAGVGRTGVYIVLDIALDRMSQGELNVDIYGYVTHMRSQRNYVVQTEEQYMFAYDATCEAIECGETVVPAHLLRNHVHKLLRSVAKATASNYSAASLSVTEMELEFRRLGAVKTIPAKFTAANMVCNKFKNRLVNVLPSEWRRVPLKSVFGVDGSDYINASYIDGFWKQHAYIATQGPLAETTDDFWRMLWEQNSCIIVMLTKLCELGRERCHQYWPSERSARYSYFIIEFVAEYFMGQYILREFKVCDIRTQESRIIRQFQYLDWPEQGVPKYVECFIDFITNVHKTKEQFGLEGPITVHCNAGVGRTGVCIALSVVLEEIKFDQTIDIFQTVRLLRTQRPAMVQTEDQYQFCYRSALEYLGSVEKPNT